MDAHDLQRQGMLESVLAAANIGMVVLDAERQVVLWNRWMAQHSGLAAEQVLGRDFFDVFPDLNNKRIEAAVTQALRGFPSVLSQTLHKAPFPLFAHAGGPRMQQAVAVTPVDVAGSARHCLIQISDVSAAVNRERLLRVQALELRSQTFSDGLTGIANRRHFDVAIEKELRRAKRAATPLSLLMIDIDHFKAYNDHYGHQQGDDTLIRVAAALQAMVQRPMDLIARYGGEEFSVILPELDEAHALALAEHMRERVRALAIPHEFTGSADPFVTISIGIATQTVDHPTEVSSLIGAADRALYDAKHAGRNRVSVQQP
jgi:diguanylate cyclase (GGDEF)-like protein/PAS domain S-box-containing protein